MKQAQPLANTKKSKSLLPINIILILSILLASCIGKGPADPKKHWDKQPKVIDFNGLSLSPDFVKTLEKETGKSWEPFKREIWKINADQSETEEVLNEGIQFSFVDESSARLAFQKYMEYVHQQGYYLFLSNIDFDDNYRSYYDVIILPYQDPYIIIEKLGTHAINYDLFNDDIIKMLRQWDVLYGLSYEIMDESRIHAYIDKKPKDIRQFTQEVFEFCPDVIYQGYGSMEEMVKDYEANQYIWLWWD